MTACPAGARIVTDAEELAVFFSADRASHIYALGDLDEPYWSASTWWRRGSAVVGRVGLPGADPVIYSVSTSAPDETLALVADLADAGELGPSLVTGPVGVGAALRQVGQSLEWNRGYHRFALVDGFDGGGVPEPVHGDELEPLGSSSAPELAELYAVEPGAAFFLPSMLDSETFFGARCDGRLVAVAGTHVCSEKRGVAAIGAVFTHPHHRGRGLGARVTAAVVERLTGRVDVIGLNCTDANVGARRIYERLGFEAGLAYEECEIAR